MLTFIDINFVDDTLIFLKIYHKMIKALKLFLQSFENILGFKINCTKK
jgi:hypothetical protein